MLPLARTALRRIGNDTDVVTFISHYTRDRFASAFGPRAALEHLAPGVDTDRFEPNSVARAEMRARYRLGERPVVLCLSRLVPRKGQDMLIRALPAVRERIDGATLVIVGGGPYRGALHRLAHQFGVAEHVVFTDGVPSDELPAHHAMADVFAMPCRTRGAGLDVEGLGIVYLEASATGVPVVAGRSGGAPETVVDGETGLVVDGWDVGAIAAAVGDVLADPDRAVRMGAAGRRWVVDNWQWRYKAQRLAELLSG
jgi:phosphatidylinositol alpha-1,6-mannosyltransferase